MILGALMVVLGMAAGAAPAASATHEEVRPVMGTVATVRAWAAEPVTATAAVGRAYHTFARVDSLMSTWRNDSALSELNRAEPGQWVDVGEELAQVLAEALTTAEASGGTYDPTVLPLVVLWGFRGGEVAYPSEEAVDRCLQAVGHGSLEVDPTGGRVRKGRSGMAIDLGGIAKGHALDEAAEAMRAAGATSGYLDLGGNILVFGEESAFEVGVLGPDGDQVLATLPLANGSVATSGQYENFVLIDGVAFGHILDPRTGWPVPSGVSATVLADRAITADALATAAVVLGPDLGLRLLESRTGVEGVIILRGEGGQVRFLATSGLMESP